jgi:hypothetical protein
MANTARKEVRAWWQDLLINAGGAALGAIIAAVVIAVAGKLAGLFDSSVEFNLVEFLLLIVGFVAGVGTIVGAISTIVNFLQ